MARGQNLTGLAPRKAALGLLTGVLSEARLLPELIGDGAVAHLPPEDRARAQRLALETLRHLDRADRLLKPHLQKNPPLAVRNALRLGTVELCQGAAAHGVVNAMVDLVASGKRTRNYKGLVNAVLRKVADGGPESWAASSVSKMPNWLRQPMVAAWSRKTVEEIEAVHAASVPLDLTAKGDPEALAERVGGTLLPTGSVRLAHVPQVSALPGYEAGEWWVQDAAASLPVRLLGDVTGKRAIDLCAAPGGKTMQLAAAGAQVTAIDDNAARMARVTENLARTGLAAETVVSDAFDVNGHYDIVLLDAPCSATGTIRRHPDLPYAKDGSDFGALMEQQTQMIDHALGLLAPGGRLMFCTCSLLPDEGEVQIEEALARHKGLKVAPVNAPGIEDAWRTEEGGVRLRPDIWAARGGVDGFYMACLVKA